MLRIILQTATSLLNRIKGFKKTYTAKINLKENNFYNIWILFVFFANFPFTVSEAKHDH